MSNPKSKKTRNVYEEEIDILLEKSRARRLAFEHLALALTNKIETQAKTIETKKVNI